MHQQIGIVNTLDVTLNFFTLLLITVLVFNRLELGTRRNGCGRRCH